MDAPEPPPPRETHQPAGAVEDRTTRRRESWCEVLDPQAAPHDATHSYAENKDPKLIQQSLGHADIGTTMGLYVDETAGESTAKVLSKHLKEE